MVNKYSRDDGAQGSSQANYYPWFTRTTKLTYMEKLQHDISEDFTAERNLDSRILLFTNPSRLSIWPTEVTRSC